MKLYDPLEAPNPEEWLSLDEAERIRLVKDYHSRACAPRTQRCTPWRMSSSAQIALGDELPVRRKAQRLMAEGLDRHEALHAIGSVVMEHVFEILRTPGPVLDPKADPNAAYFAALEKLTIEEWRQLAEDEDDETLLFGALPGDEDEGEADESLGLGEPLEEEMDADEILAWRGGTMVSPFKGVGRNDPCPCGSGKKFKKCCLNRDAA